MVRYRQETPNSIYIWNKETFGAGTRGIASRALLELSELVIACVNENDDAIKEEIADAAIMLWAVAASINVDARPKIETRIRRPYEVKQLSINIHVHLLKYIEKLVSPRAKDSAPFLIRALTELEELIDALKVDIPSLVDEKMQRNRKRDWCQVSPGNYQHVA